MINWLEWLGYVSSVLVAVSLLMSSIIKLRWYNLVGSLAFAVYGFLINALPVALINTIVVFINIYYLIKIYTAKEFFKLIEIEEDSKYLQSYFEYYRSDMKKFFPDFKFSLEGAELHFCILRNMAAAGLFIAREYDKESLAIDLDYVVPEYRDFKIGKFIFDDNEKYFKDKGYKRLISVSPNKLLDVYLKKMGFKETLENGKRILVRYIGINK